MRLRLQAVKGAVYLVVVNSISQLLGIVLHILGAALPQELHVLLGCFGSSGQESFYSILCWNCAHFLRLLGPLRDLLLKKAAEYS